MITFVLGIGLMSFLIWNIYSSLVSWRADRIYKRSVGKMEQDIQSCKNNHELLDRIVKSLYADISGVKNSFSSVLEKITKVEADISGHHQGCNSKISSLESKIGGLAGSTDQLDKKMEGLEKDIKDVLERHGVRLDFDKVNVIDRFFGHTK